MTIFKRKPRLLKDIAVSEISVVDKAAAPGARIVLLKRDRDRAALKAKIDKAVACLAASVQSIINDDSVENKNVMLRDTFGQCLAHLGEITKYKISLSNVSALHRIFDVPRNKNLDVSVDEADADEGRDNLDKDKDDEDETGSTPHFHAGTDEGEATKSTDQLERARRAMKMENNMTREQELSNFVKRHGIAAVARSVNEKGVFLTEAEYSKLLSEDCARTGRDFSKAIEGGSASDPDTIEIAKAWRRCSDAGFASRQATMSKAATLEPSFVGGADARNVDNPKAALDQINELVAIQRKNNPTLTEAQAFEQVYMNPRWADLVRREREENRPVAWG